MQPVEDGGDRLAGGPRAVGVLDAQQEFAAPSPCIQPVEQGGAAPPMCRKPVWEGAKRVTISDMREGAD